MIAIVAEILLVVGAVWIIIHFVRSKPLFIIAFRDGVPTAIRGKVPHRFLQECKEIAESNEIVAGRIDGIEKDQQVSLKFSSEIPEDTHQQFRNVWVLHRSVFWAERSESP